MVETTRLTIGALAARVGVPVSTVRYYERRRLLCPSGRSEGNYRQYDEGSVDRLRFIRVAQEAGFTLSDIGALLAYLDADDDERSCESVQHLIERRLSHVRDELAHLQSVEGLLEHWLSMCRDADHRGCCAVLEGLVSRVETTDAARSGKSGECA